MLTDDELAVVWGKALESLGDGTLTPQQKAFVTLTKPLALVGETFLLAAPNEFTKDVLETRLRPLVTTALSEAIGEEVRLAISVDETIAPGLDDATDEIADATYAQNLPEGFLTFSNPRPGGGTPVSRQDENSRLNPKYIFDNFVAGSSNKMAHAAAVATAEMPARAYNPLFIYGESGLGKTHLLHAIGNYSQVLYQGIRVRYVSSEEFTNDFINSIRDDKAAAFQKRYRNVDVLLIDDIQFLSGKTQTQEEFFHTFNTLHNADKQIVVTSDLPPKQLQDFEDRMRSRFEWGLITDIKPPELETRIAILRKKVVQEKLLVPDEVLEFIASRVTTNIRELEGALIRISAYAGLNKVPVELALAEVVLKDLIPDQVGPQITSTMIMTQTGQYFGISIDDLIGSSRSRTLVTARQIAMYLCRELTDLSLPRIGSSFGGRDHTTVMHAERKVRQLMTERRGIYNQVADLTTRIKTEARNS